MSNDIAVMSLSLTFKLSPTQPENYALGMSPEGSLKVLTSGTYKGSSGDSQGTNTKTDELTKKLFFKSNSPCITYVILFSAGKKKFKSYTWRPGRPRDFYGTQLRVVPKTKWREALGTFARRWSNMVFKFNSQTHWIYFDRLLKTFWWKVLAKHSVNSIVVKNIT